jgi:hypothetical protein
MNTLAFYIYPTPRGTHYTSKDLNTPEKVEKLFDYMQIHLAIISKEGWDFLIKQYGYEQLFEINKRSKWLDCKSLKEFIERIEYEKEISPLKL